MEKKDRLIKILFFVIILIISIFLFAIYFRYVAIGNRKVENIDLNDIDNLMIVAHPDDEMLWGGGALIKDSYLVVCVTCGRNKLRNYEFSHVIEKTNDKFIALGYLDKDKRKRRHKLEIDYKRLKKDIDQILSLKDWKLVVTHNPEGEYGHSHHKVISKIVAEKYDYKEKLFYFGKYYTKKEIKKHTNSLIPLEEDVLLKKNEILGNYGTQIFYQYRFDHIIPYENWIKYDDWSKYEKKK